MNKYEMMYIIDAALEDAPRKELIEKVSAQIAANGGVVEKVDEWGKRRLAYAINYKTEGAGAALPGHPSGRKAHQREAARRPGASGRPGRRRSAGR